MYRIQAHNLQSKQIEIYKIMSYEYFDFTNKLKATGNYGLIEAEYLSRY